MAQPQESWENEVEWELTRRCDDRMRERRALREQEDDEMFLVDESTRSAIHERRMKRVQQVWLDRITGLGPEGVLREAGYLIDEIETLAYNDELHDLREENDELDEENHKLLVNNKELTDNNKELVEISKELVDMNKTLEAEIKRLKDTIVNMALDNHGPPPSYSE